MESFRSFSSQSNASSNSSQSVSVKCAQLEQLWKTPAVDRRPAAVRPAEPLLKRLGRWLYGSMTDTQQLRIWTKKTRDGVVWCAYDPRCDRAITCNSEASLRAWLEQRHLS
ncbi:MAG: hypothetical protein AAFY33_01770 [Cyanobacteria bacterium J06643_4]